MHLEREQPTSGALVGQSKEHLACGRNLTAKGETKTFRIEDRRSPRLVLEGFKTFRESFDLGLRTAGELLRRFIEQYAPEAKADGGVEESRFLDYASIKTAENEPFDVSIEAVVKPRVGIVDTGFFIEAVQEGCNESPKVIPIDELLQGFKGMLTRGSAANDLPNLVEEQHLLLVADCGPDVSEERVAVGQWAGWVRPFRV